MASPSQSFISACWAWPDGGLETVLRHERAACESAFLASSPPLASAYVAVSPTDPQAPASAVPGAPPSCSAESLHVQTAESTDCSASEPADPVAVVVSV